VTELDLIGQRAVREIGLAWLDGQRDAGPVASFKDFLLARRGSLLPR
jgi:hypothetical protein